MRVSRHIAVLVLALSTYLSPAWGAPAKREPRVGYLFPGGGQQGATIEVIVGGQFLRKADAVHISGEGVRASVIRHYRPFRVVYKEQRQELVRQLVAAREKRLAALPRRVRVPPYPGEWRRIRAADKRKDAKTQDTVEATSVELPDHPLLSNLSSKSLRELQHVANEFLGFKSRKKKQRNVQIGEMVLIKVTIDATATPGYREVRLRTSLGITNPMRFQIGTLPETREQEPNDPGKFTYLPKASPLQLPMVLNGQIMPGDVDWFRFEAKQGQQLVIETHARRLVPFLADAVPGWFQATVALYDSQGCEVAFADDYRFHPDPVLFYRVPEDGVYELELRDSIYRGREDFVYRVVVSELPFITQMFPLGGRKEVKTVASIDGWNLPANRLELDTASGSGAIRQQALCARDRISNEVIYAVDTLPESTEVEPNDNTGKAQEIILPAIINGRISRPGDVDVFEFEGRDGDEVVAEVLGRRLQSPLDSVLRLTDASGRVLKWNDDEMRRSTGYLHPGMGLLTHQADSYLRTRLPKNGTYYVYLADTQNHGSDAYAYRLRLSAPRPNFDLRMTPSSLNMRAGQVTPFAVHALRRDGFQGEIDVTLKDAPEGFVLAGGHIPAGCDGVRMTLTAPRKAFQEPIALHVQGSAWIDGEAVSRPVLPAEDMMQAFLFRHLVPSQELMVTVTKGWGFGREVALAGGGPVRIPAGGTAQVLFLAERLRKFHKIELELKEPLQGMTLHNMKIAATGLTFQLTVEGDAAKVGYADNAIVEVFTERPVRKKGRNGKQAPTQMRRVSLGILPAVPFIIVQP